MNTPVSRAQCPQNSNATSSAGETLCRRAFLGLAARGSAGALLAWTPTLLAGTSPLDWDPRAPFRVLGRVLKVQPVFMYALPQRREQSSWRSWGGVQTESAVSQEVARITNELARIAAKAEFGLELLPVAKVTSPEAADQIATRDHDLTLLYACTGSASLLRACLRGKSHALIFVRHRSGPVYYWYEALSTQYLQKEGAQPASADDGNILKAHVDDVVVDDCGELLWRLRALCAAKNFLGTRIVALGGPWGKYAPDAPQKAKERFQLEIVDVSYEAFAPRLRRARADRALVSAAEKATAQYLALPKTRLSADRQAVVNAFVLYQVFKDLMQEHRATAFTVKSCMGTIIPMSETTACLPLGLLNDEGLIAFCESDFVIIPAGLLLRHIAGKPVFLHNSTYPHQRTVTCAHCTSPRRLDGRKYAPAKIVTHYESDYGAAPKVSMPIGQEVTFIDPEYSSARWVGFKGIVKANPFYDICRSQQDVEIQGDWQKLRSEARDSHWIMVYGEYLREIGFAARKLGLEWVNLSAAA
ncbi:MAG TPA: sugar isomerase [Verrucomicrobiae bacterium]